MENLSILAMSMQITRQILWHLSTAHSKQLPGDAVRECWYHSANVFQGKLVRTLACRSRYPAMPGARSAARLYAASAASYWPTRT